MERRPVVALESDDARLAASVYEAGDRRAFSVTSRGDRVPGLLIRQDRTSGLHLVLVISPDGSAVHPLVEQLASEWADWAAVASIDLPLCGRRSSEKLSPIGKLLDHPIGRQIRGDLVSQTRCDLERSLTVLSDQDGVDGSRVGCLAVGFGADLVDAIADADDLFDAIESDPDGGAAWLREAGKRLRDRLEG